MIRESIWKAVWRVNRIFPLCLGGLFTINVLLLIFLNYHMESKATLVQSKFIKIQAEERRTQDGREDSETPVVIYTRGIEHIKKFRQAIPVKSEFTGLIGELFSLADRAGLKISSVNYNSKNDSEQQLLQYKINYQVSGTYKQIKKMIHMIEQSDRIVIIDELSLDSAEKGRSVNLSVALITFFRMDQA